MAEGLKGKGNIPQWAIITIGVGLFVSVIGIMFALLAPSTDHLTSVADGVVTKVEAHTSTSKKKTGTTYLTYVRFEDSDHQVWEARSVVNGSKRHSVGDSVTVHYDPRDPEAGCLIEGDEDRLFIFKLFENICRYGGPVTLLVGLIGAVVGIVQKRS